MLTHLKIIGILLVLLSLIHAVFPRYFKWDEELKSLSLINRQMMIIHTFFIAFIVFLMGIFCLMCSNEILETPLGRKIALGFAVFWLLRLFLQFFGYSSELWKGKIFETSIHILFTMLWLYFILIFVSIGWHG
ncbi:MAG: hypothetical protein RLZZ546_2878 [Bacteroidota bacterium]|jgi:hypothetical protein